MNELQIFNNEHFGQVRTAIINSEPYFMLADVCRVLDIANPTRAKERLKENGLHSMKVIDNMNREQQATFISESNLYKLAFTSRKKEAENFTDWVTGEILPTLRKTGTYSMQKANPLEVLQQIGQSINKTIEALVEQDKRMKNIETVTRLQNDRIGDMEKKVQLIHDIETINCDNWRTHVRPLINQIAKYIPVLDSTDRFSAAWQESYRRLEQKFNCNLTLRVNNKKERLRQAGATKKVIEKVNNLDVIGEDKRLIECYISILKNMVLEYKRAA